MAYQLKSTGPAASCIMCLAVDPDTGTIKDFASSAVTADMTVGANVTISTQTFDGITRHYWQPGSGTTDADFVRFGTNKPSFTFNASNTTRTVVWIGQTDTAGISRFWGADASNNYFAHLNIASGGSTHPAISIASNGYHGAQTNPSNSKIICGWVLNRGSTRRWYTAADTAASMTTGSTALGNVDASYSLDYVDRVNSSTTHQRQKTHFLLQFNTALTEADMDALRDDAFNTLLEVAGGGDTTAPTISVATAISITSSSATIQATTDEGNGTAYVVVSTSATTPSAAQIIAGQDHTGSAAIFVGNTAVTAVGAFSRASTGLSASTAYYGHLVHRDAANNNSNTLTTAQFTTSPSDTTAPILSSATVTSIASTTATIGATTDEGNGTFYGVVTTNVTAPTSVQVEAGQDHTGAAAFYAGNVAVSSTGTKTLSSTGLTASTSYYAHMMHKDAAGNRSTVITSAQFTTTSGDTTAPTLSSATVTSITATSASIGATTNEGNGTAYIVVTTSNTQPSVAQIIAGQTHTGSAATFAGNIPITATGAFSIGSTGLTSATSYYGHIVHRDSSINDSNRISTAQFTTLDNVVPTLSGTVTASTITQTTYTLTWPAGSDNVAVTSYEYSLNAGTSYTDVGNALTVNVTGRTAGATDAVRVRAKDAAGNVSSPLSLNVTLLNYGVDLQTDTVTYTVKNNTGTILSGTEFKLTFYRQDTDAFVVNKTITTDGSGLLGIVRDATLASGVVYDIKITNTANNHKGIFAATGGAV